uniref:Activin_recp domain-containing protein n=1 Tax=Panagrellus redivivus TaxID=6233 RepID=A0A7E4W905_PANRE
MTTSMLVALSLCFLALVSNVAGGITCYRGINIKMPGAYFNQTMNSLGCNNANYCLRGFGTFNGEEGWYSSCVDWQKEDVTCKTYPACQQVVKGNSSYTACCCKEALCNHLDFTGEAPATTTVKTTTDSTAAVTVSVFLLILAIFM